MRSTPLFFILFFLAILAIPFAIHAQSFDPLGLIGLDPASALQTLGPPVEVFPYRGADAAEDNVVFFYPDFTYLFWFRNRVWQVRFDQRFTGTVFGLKLGMRQEVVGLPGNWRLIEAGDSLYFDPLEADYPIRVRLVFSEGLLHDIYVYRRDY